MTNVNIIANCAYAYAYVNQYTITTTSNIDISNDMSVNCKALNPATNIHAGLAECNCSALNPTIKSGTGVNININKAICNCSANNATIDLDNLKFPKYTFTTSARNLSFEG